MEFYDGDVVQSYSAEFQRRRQRRSVGSFVGSTPSSVVGPFDMTSSQGSDGDVSRMRFNRRNDGVSHLPSIAAAAPATMDRTPGHERKRTSFPKAQSAPKRHLRFMEGLDSPVLNRSFSTAKRNVAADVRRFGEDPLLNCSSEAMYWKQIQENERQRREHGVFRLQQKQRRLLHEHSQARIQSPNPSVYGVYSQSATRRRPQSPPPPPPPPSVTAPRIAAYPAPNLKPSLKHRRKPSEVTSMQAYAASIASGATSHRRGSIERSSKALMNRIRLLEDTVEKHHRNESKLQNVNMRLQDRLVVFQKQNHENVNLAKRRIAELEEQLKIKQTQLVTMSITPRSHSSRYSAVPSEAGRSVKRDQRLLISGVNDASVLRERAVRQQEALGEWKRANKVAEFRAWRTGRATRETKACALRAWACAVLLRKICTQARMRRSLRCANRCFRAWRQQTELQLLEIMRFEWARDYFTCVVHLRRCLRAWQRVASEGAAERRTRRLTEVLWAWRGGARHQRNRCLSKYFSRWRLFHSRLLKEQMERYEARYLLMPTTRGLNSKSYLSESNSTGGDEFFPNIANVKGTFELSSAKNNISNECTG